MRAVSLFLLLGLFIVGGIARPAHADQTDERLDALFARLQETKDSAEGRHLTRQIRIIWRQTDNSVASDALNRAGVELFMRRYQGALEALNQAVSAEPELAEAWSRRAAVFYLLGDFPSAVADIRQTLALEPRHFGALAELGAIYMRLEDFDAARQALTKALEINPHLAATRRNLESVEKRLAGDRAWFGDLVWRLGARA